MIAPKWEEEFHVDDLPTTVKEIVVTVFSKVIISVFPISF